MPIYEFRCRNCNARFEVLVRAASSPVTCPNCGAALLEKQVSAPAVVSAGEYREAGRTCCGREGRCERPPCSDGSGCRRG